MKKAGIIMVVFQYLIISATPAFSSADSLNIAPFGKVFIYRSKETPKNVAVLISGDGGWKYGVVDFAASFSEMGNLVIGVDILKYYSDLRKRPDDCYNVAADFVQLVTEIEKKFNFPDYRPAVVMGYSSGATLVYGILAQARPGTFMGGISLGFCPDIELPKMLCQVNGLTEKVFKEGKSFYLNPDARLGNHWIVLQGKLDKICNYEEIADFVGKTTDAELVTLPNVGHGFSKWSDFMPQWKQAFTHLADDYEKGQQTTPQAGNIESVPIVLTGAKSEVKDAPIAVLISGDGGWYTFEQRIADNLAKDGIPTLGLDSKKYFWNRKSPEQAAADMENVLNYYSKLWGKNRFMFIGYSLGAEIVPFIVNRLPADMRANIFSVVLLSPETTTDFEIHISNMMGIGSRQNTYNVVEEIIKMEKVTALIIFGEGEKTKIPGLLTGMPVKIAKIPGDHHYKFDLPLIIKTMKDNNVL